MASENISEVHEHPGLADSDQHPSVDPDLSPPLGQTLLDSSCGTDIEQQNGSPAVDLVPEPDEKGRSETTAVEDWVVMACVFLTNVLTGCDTTAISALYAALARHYGASHAAVGWCAGIQCFTAALASILVSYPIKTYGCRRTAVVGALLYAVGIGFSALAPNLLTLYCTYGLVAGFGSSFSLLPSIIILQQRFQRHGALVNAFSAVGLSLGGMAGPHVTSLLLERYELVGTFLMLGAMQANRIPLAMCFWNHRIAQSSVHKKSVVSPSQSHSAPRSPTSSSGCQTGVVARCNTCHAKCRGLLRYLSDVIDFTVLLRLPFTLFLISSCLLTFTYGYWPHLPGSAVHAGLTRVQGVWAVSAMSVTSLLSKLLMMVVVGWRCVSRLVVFTIGLFGGVMAMVVWLVVPGVAGLFLSAVFYGLLLGCTNSISAVVVLDLVGLKLLPRCIALQHFFTGFFRLGAVPFLGWIFDLTGSYDIGFMVYGVLFSMAIILMISLYFIDRNKKRAEKQLQKVHGPEALES